MLLVLMEPVLVLLSGQEKEKDHHVLFSMHIQHIITLLSFVLGSMPSSELFSP